MSKHSLHTTDSQVRAANMARDGVSSFWQEDPNDLLDERAKQRKKRLDAAGIPHRFAGAALEHFESEPALWKILGAYIESYDDGRGLYIWAPRVGVGKTHLACALAHWFIDQGDLVIFFNVAQWLEEIRQSYNAGALKVPQLEQFDVVILDDFCGEEKVSEWVRERIYLIINGCYQHLKAPIITSNVTLDAIRARYGERVESRIAGMCSPLQLSGPDRRKVSQAVVNGGRASRPSDPSYQSDPSDAVSPNSHAH